MGVHGLTSYILENSSLFLKPYELSDCTIIIDGLNVAYRLGCGLKSDSVFGGDYDEYYTLVKNFLLALKKCNISPVVLFDGGCTASKLKTKIFRRRNSILKLQSYCKGFSKEQFFPLFLSEVFVSVAMELEFTLVRCNLEADGEIAAIARALNCPVLSYDSDYFIYDVLYIPFTSLMETPVKHPLSGKYYLNCSLYNVNDFLEMAGVEKPLLPILATLLGNDHVENAIFHKFFNHIKVPHIKSKSYARRRIIGLMRWLRNENLDSAIKTILSHLEKKHGERVLEVFNTVIDSYNTAPISESVLNELKNKFSDIELLKSDFKIDFPSVISELLAKCLIPGPVVNIIEHQIYFTFVQVENIHEESTHLKCLNLIKKIYTMLFPYLRNKQQLQVYLIKQRQYKPIHMDADLSDSISLDEALKQPLNTRVKLLCDIVGVPLDEITIVLDNSWAIFIMSFIYWVKEFKNSLSLAHIHAFTIMAIANQVVQTRVGYYRNSPDFMKRYGEKLAKLKGRELSLHKSSHLKEMLKNVDFYECLLVQKDLIPLRRTTEAGSQREYSLSTIHLFNSFQSCLFHIMFLNALLNFPLPCLKIQDFYSGTLLFNLYVNIKSNRSVVDKFGSVLFSRTPNLNQIYKYLSENFARVLGKTEVQGRRKRTN